MIVSIIVAMSEDRGIGQDGQLPWHLPSDLKRFKRLTMGHHLIMGRSTFESLGRALPGRQIIVLSRDPDYRPEGALPASSLGQALDLAASKGETEVFICGGAQIYAQSLARADRMYLTLVHAQPLADTYFPPYDQQPWVESCSENHPAGEQDQFATTFKLLERRID